MNEFIRNIPSEVIQTMFNQGAIRIDLEKGFTLKGGITSPLFCETAVLESDLRSRAQIGSRLLFWLNYHYEHIDAFVGVESGGVSWATTLSNNNMLPLLRVHPFPKDHGLFNQIEGELPFDGANVLVIDDVITSGRSVLSVVDALRAGKNGKKANVLGVCSIFDWDFPSVNKQFEKAGIEKTHIATFDSILDYGFANNLLSDEVKEKIQLFCEEHR